MHRGKGATGSDGAQSPVFVRTGLFCFLLRSSVTVKLSQPRRFREPDGLILHLSYPLHQERHKQDSCYHLVVDLPTRMNPDGARHSWYCYSGRFKTTQSTAQENKWVQSHQEGWLVSQRPECAPSQLLSSVPKHMTHSSGFHRHLCTHTHTFQTRNQFYSVEGSALLLPMETVLGVMNSSLETVADTASPSHCHSSCPSVQ